MRTLACLLLALLFAAPLAARQDPAPVNKAVEDYLRVQTKGLPGRAGFSVGSLDAGNNLAPCAAFEVGIPPGARLWGRTNVVVRCMQQGGWSVYIPVRVQVFADYLIAARPLLQGQVLTEADVARQNGDLAELPLGVVTEARQAVGRVAAQSIPAGKPMRADMLRQSWAIRQGQGVKVVSRGPGFQVANEGRAVNNAAEGQVAQVRLPNGQIVSGIAREGYVEVGF